MTSPAQTTSPPSIRWISWPPAAAQAAGGRGIRGSRCVYSVGFSRLLAGGAVEMAAWPEWLLVAVVPSSGGGAPWSVVADPPPSSRSRLLGAVLRANPSPETAGRRLRVFEDPDRAGGAVHGVGFGDARWRLSGA